MRGCCGYTIKAVGNGNEAIKEVEDSLVEFNVRRFSLKSIHKATNNFRIKLHSDRFSSHYKGTLQNGTQVIVQKLTRVTPFPGINILSRIRHRNVIDLIGYCVEADNWIVVYESADDQRLDHLLFKSDSNNNNNVVLSWSVRASICLGVARGLDYLHSGIGRPVVHRDIKPSNVLVDHNYNPKIAGFELAYVGHDNTSLESYSGPLCGTYGYVDPEYCLTGRFTAKSDVYAFGILLLELICGRKAIHFSTGNINLVEWVQGLQDSDRVLNAADPRLTHIPDYDELMRFIDVALLCVQQPAHLRPTMSEVLLMLAGFSDTSKIALSKLHFTAHDTRLRALEMDEGELLAGSKQATPGMVTRSSVTETEGKLISLDEIEVENDSVATSEVNLSHDLVSELYKLVVPQVGVSEAGPSNQVVRKTEMRNTLSEADIAKEGAVQIDLQLGVNSFVEPDVSDSDSISGQRSPVGVSEAGSIEETVAEPDRMSNSSNCIPSPEEAFKVAEQVQISDLLVGLNTSAAHDISTSVSISRYVNPEIRTSSAQTDHSEYIDRFSLQVEGSRRDRGHSPLKINTDGPIRRTVEKMLEVFREAQSRKICLYGRGGSGKTTVLRTLSNHAASVNLFDVIIFVNTPRLDYQRKIQSQITKQLSLNILDSSPVDETAARIYDALTGTPKKILLLLDDVWETINLQEVGIPEPGPDNNCWLVFSSRFLDICSEETSMQMQMDVLTTTEAWELFRYQVGDVVDPPRIESLARVIADECHGLPLMISIVASALKTENSVVAWKLALKSILLSDMDLDTHSHNRYTENPIIKYRYDKLKDDGAKTCFLYCALFANDKEVDIHMLVDCFIDEGLLGGRTLAAHRKGLDIIKLLLDASLLELTAEGHKVKMHNVVRDTALAVLSSSTEGYGVLTGSYLRASPVPRSSILSNQFDKYLIGANTQWKESPEVDEWMQAEMMFLMDNRLSSLPSKPSCPTLEALLLQRNNCLINLPTSFFDGMGALRILNLTKTRISCLPDSLGKLESLEVLVLRDCERLSTLPPSIGCLKALKVLDVQGTELIDLPDSFHKLASLNQLRVSFYGSINQKECTNLPATLIPEGAISMMDLIELGIFVYPGDPRWTSCASNIIDEVSSLKLSALYFHFPDGEHLGHFISRNKSWNKGNLATFNFIVGHDFNHAVSQVSNDTEMRHEGEKKCLKFVNGQNIPSAIQEILSDVTSFYLDHHLSICNLSDFGISNVSTLKVCIIRDCPNMRAIIHVNGCSHPVLPLLEYLSINYSWNLEKIWAGQVTAGSLANLRYLSLRACANMRFVLTCSMVNILPHLEELLIEDCASLHCIVSEEETPMDDSIDSNVVEGPHASDISGFVSGTSALSSLKVLKLHHLPKLCGIWKGCWPPLLEYLSFYDCPMLKNLCMEANDAVSIKEIVADKDWWDMLQWEHHDLSKRLSKHVTQIDLDDL